MDILSIENKRINIDHLNIVSKISKYLNNIKISEIRRPSVLNFDIYYGSKKKKFITEKELMKIKYHSKLRRSLDLFQYPLISEENHKQKQNDKDNFVKSIDDDETLFTNRIGNRSNEYYSPKIHNQVSTKLQILNNCENKIFKHKNNKVNHYLCEKNKLNIDMCGISELKEFTFVSMVS